MFSNSDSFYGMNILAKVKLHYESYNFNNNLMGRGEVTTN